MTMHQIEESREKRRAALLSVGSAVVLVSLKRFLVLRTGSLGVLSEALHSSTDGWSTLIVIAGIGLVWAGETWRMPWLNYADALAALAVAAVILWVGARLGKRTLDALLDVAPEGLQQEIAKAVARMDGVLDVDRVRVRRAGNRHFVDATVSVARTASLEQVHALSDAIEQRIGEIVPSDVMVHAEPRAPQGEHLFEAIRAAAQKMGLAVHDLTAVQQDGQLFIELHLEVDEHLSLGNAHRQATELEEKIRELRDGQVEVNIHIEPLGTHIATPDAGGGEMKQLSRAIEEFLNKLPLEFSELVNCHDVRVRQVEHHILVSCHCTMRSELPITQIHDVTAALEDRVKEKFPQIYRLTIHPEPFEEK